MERTPHDKVVYAGFWDTVPGYRKTSTGQFGTNFEGFWDTVTPHWDAEKIVTRANGPKWGEHLTKMLFLRCSKNLEQGQFGTNLSKMGRTQY